MMCEMVVREEETQVSLILSHFTVVTLASEILMSMLIMMLMMSMMTKTTNMTMITTMNMLCEMVVREEKTHEHKNKRNTHCKIFFTQHTCVLQSCH